MPDVQAVLRSGGGVAAAQCAPGQANTPPKELPGVPPSAGESVPAGTKICRLIFLFTDLVVFIHPISDNDLVDHLTARAAATDDTAAF